MFRICAANRWRVWLSSIAPYSQLMRLTNNTSTLTLWKFLITTNPTPFFFSFSPRD